MDVTWTGGPAGTAGQAGAGVWSLVVPLKRLAVAKSRLVVPVDGLRPALVLAFVLDTVAAVLACPRVADVTVVTDDPLAGAEAAALGALVEPDAPAAGLNAALRFGAERVRRRAGEVGVAALNGDLPALRPAELAEALAEAARLPGRAFLADTAGTGTTLLTASPGVALSPGFGGSSRARHLASGAREITLSTVPSVRQDVDTAADLEAARTLGLGPRTAHLVPAATP